MEIFPAIGFEYEIVFGAKIDDEDIGDMTGDIMKAGDLSQFRIKLGVGYDYLISEKVCIRALALYGLGLPSEFSKKYKENYSDSSMQGSCDAATTHKVAVKIGVGFKF